MNFQDCIDFAKKVHTCYIATTEGDQPHVRPIGLLFADDRGFYFFTETVKAFHRQLQGNKKVELCFHGGDPSKVMRVTGQIEFVNDAEIKAQVMTRPFLKGLDNIVSVFRIARGEAFFWTMADTMKEAQLPRIKFGKA